MNDRDTAILFCGDCHGRFDHVIAAAHRLQPEAVVLLGDMEFTRPAHIELAAIADVVWFITGNHDTDRPEAWANLMESGLADRCLDGRVVTLPSGIRLAGLGGVWRAKCWAPPAPAVHESYDAWLDSLQSGWHKRQSMYATERLKHRSTIFPAVYDKLALQQADILVTHEAPSPHPYGWAAVDELAQALGVRESYHGHQHDSLNHSAHWPRLTFQCFGVGLRGITARGGRVIVPGELDDERGRRRSIDAPVAPDQ